MKHTTTRSLALHILRVSLLALVLTASWLLVDVPSAGAAQPDATLRDAIRQTAPSVRAQNNEQARFAANLPKLRNAVSMLENKIAALQQRVGTDANLVESDRSTALALLARERSSVAAHRAAVEALTDLPALRIEARSLLQYWNTLKQTFKRVHARVRVGHLHFALQKSARPKNLLTEKVSELTSAGRSVENIKPVLNAYQTELQLATAQYDAVRAALERNEDVPEAMLNEGKKHLEQSVPLLRRAIGAVQDAAR